MKLVTAKMMQKLEKIAMDEFQIPSLLLMENAARGFVDAIRVEYGCVKNKKVAVFCGRGNNGGDGFAIARMLFNLGADVSVFIGFDRNRLSGDAKSNFTIISKMRLPIEKDWVNKQFDIIVDAIFGTGFHGEISGAELSMIEYINQSNAFVASVDIPSGAVCDNGGISNICVKSDMTVTFAIPKVGHFLFPAKDYVGKLHIADISLPKTVIQQFNSSYHLLDRETEQLLPKRAANTHKGSFGKVLLFAGSEGMSGACVMAANAVLKSGAGMATAAVPHEISNIVATKLTEVMTLSLPSAEKEAFSLLTEKLATQDVLLMGCGLGQAEVTKKLIQHLLIHSEKPIVLDADGINALCGNINIIKRMQAPIIMTPHLVEFSRITGMKPDDVLADKLNLASAFAKEYGVILVLKGADTIVAHPNGTVYINPVSNSGMATAGSGDVLAGIITGMLAQGASACDAANIGVYVHSLAGELAKEEFGAYGMTALDICNKLPLALKKIEE